MKLSKIERYSLSNQLRILEALYPNEASEFAVQREVFENGYELLYESGMQHVYDDDDVLTEKECLEVWDTMEMFEGIDRSFKNLGIDHDEHGFTKFRGYDGNSEGKFMSFAEFTVKKERRFAYLPLNEADYFNSHMQVRETYNRMLEVWREVDPKDRYSMNKQTLDTLLNASIHPENR